MSLTSFIRWQGRLIGLWSRGGDDRHLALAHWRGDRLRRRLRRLIATAGREVVLVGLVEHMGDIIAAEPIFRAVRGQHPKAMIVHVVRRTWMPLTAEHPDVDRQEIVECLSEWYLAAHRAKTGVGPAAVYDLHIPGRVCDRCRSVTRQIPPAEPGIDLDTYFRASSLLDAFARVAGINLEGIDRRPRLHVSPPRASLPEAREKLGQRYAVVHASSNQPRKDWPPHRWEPVIAALWQEGLAVAEVGLSPVLKQAGATDLTGLPLAGTIDVIRHAALFLGIDSGPAHVANALGTPAVVVMGADPRYKRRMPFTGGLADGSGGIVIEHSGPIGALVPDPVIEAAREVLARRRTPAGAAAP